MAEIRGKISGIQTVEKIIKKFPAKLSDRVTVGVYSGPGSVPGGDISLFKKREKSDE
jgi:hypothetical protein